MFGCLDVFVNTQNLQASHSSHPWAQLDNPREMNQDAVGPAHRGFSMVQRPVCFAAHGGHSQCLQLLLAARANGNLRETGTGTALHAAAHPEVQNVNEISKSWEFRRHGNFTKKKSRFTMTCE